MKITLRSVLFVGSVLSLAGCSSLPKDSLVRGLKIGGTPWTPAIDAEVIATGKAAANLTAEERAAILATKTK